MIERIFDLPGLLIVLGIAALGFLLPLIIGAVRGESGLWRGIEAAILAVTGGMLARSFISILLGSANDSHGAGLAIGWGFFLVPGLIDTFTSQPVLTAPSVLLIIAGVVGGCTGAMAGAYRIYKWDGLGLLAFLLDVTWALAGNTVGCLLHLINAIFGEHAPETRENAHRYCKGFGLRYHPRYAFTQGSVMSNLDSGPGEGPGGDLYRHEKTHVWQNRGFGAMYTLTYVAWLLVWLIPALIVGVAIKGASGLFAGPNNWCYFNCPWETWAYAVQGVPRTSIDGVDEKDKKMIWPAKYVIAWSIPFFAVALFLVSLAVASAWSGPSAPAKSSTPAKSAPNKNTPAPKHHTQVRPPASLPEIASLGMTNISPLQQETYFE
jgi:hypothetical protein